MLRQLLWIWTGMLTGLIATDGRCANVLTFKMPPGWEVISPQSPQATIDRRDPRTAAALRDSSLMVAAADGLNPDPDGYCMNVSARLIQNSGSIDAEMVKRIAEELPELAGRQPDATSFNLISAGPVAIGNVPCGRIECEKSEAGKYIRQLVYLLPQRKWLAIVTYSATVEQYNARWREFEDYIRSTGGIEDFPRTADAGNRSGGLLFVTAFCLSVVLMKVRQMIAKGRGGELIAWLQPRAVPLPEMPAPTEVPAPVNAVKPVKPVSLPKVQPPPEPAPLMSQLLPLKTQPVAAMANARPERMLRSLRRMTSVG